MTSNKLVPGQDLPTRIRVGLEQSEFLIAMCSPHCVRSYWVDKEIRRFVESGRHDRILSVVIDGEPNVMARGFASELECLPTSLRLPLHVQPSENGKTVENVSDRPAEPLWVDFRKRMRRDRIVFLRLVAALLSLSSLDELVQRDRAHRRRKAMLTWITGTAAALAILAVGVVLLLQVRGESMKNSNTLALLARQAAHQGDWELSARYALLGMKRAGSPLIGFEPRTAEDALVGALVNNLRIGVPHDLGVKPDSMTALSRDGSIMAVASRHGAIQLIDTRTGRPRGPSFHVGEMDAFALSPDGTLLVSNFEHPHLTNDLSFLIFASGVQAPEHKYSRPSNARPKIGPKFIAT